MQINLPQSIGFSKEKLKTSKIDPFNHRLYISGVDYSKSIQLQPNDFFSLKKKKNNNKNKTTKNKKTYNPQYLFSRDHLE